MNFPFLVFGVWVLGLGANKLALENPFNGCVVLNVTDEKEEAIKKKKTLKLDIFNTHFHSKHQTLKTQ